MGFHRFACPSCNEEILVEVAGAKGGHVGEFVNVIDHRPLEADEPKQTKKKEAKSG